MNKMKKVKKKEKCQKIWPSPAKLFQEATFGIEVQLFWEGHKNLRNLPHGLDIYLVNVQTMRTIAQIFVAFSEKLNFTILRWKFWP